MQGIIKKLLNNGLDADSAEHLVPPTSFISGNDVRIGGTTDLGGVGYIETILENAEQFHVLPSGGDNTTIGFAVSDEEGWIIKFNYNSNGDHGLYLYDIVAETWYTVLLDADVTGGLNFEKNELIHSARIENGVVYWCNSELNEPRKVNIRAGVKMYHPDAFTEVVLGQTLFTTTGAAFQAPNKISVSPLFYGYFTIGSMINVSGSGSNDGNYTVVNKQLIGNTVLTVAETIVTESAGASVTFKDAFGLGVVPYTSPVSQNVLYWIRRQPGLPPTQTKMEASSYINNFINDEGFWFSYRYIYRDYEISTLSAWSDLANYNTEDETYNFIAIEIPLGETIDQDVLQVDLVVKYANSGKSFVIKSWNKDVDDDASAIEDHNSGSAALNFDYGNDFIGIALDDAYSVKPYDSLPIYAQTIEIARNRAFMANYTIGYNSPDTTSLNAAAQEATSGTLTAQWIMVEYDSGISKHYFLDMGVYGYFDIVVPIGVPPPYPTTYDYLDMALVATTPLQFATYVGGLYPDWINGFQYPGASATITNGPAAPGLEGDVSFKSGSTYKLSVHFLDHAGRKCGIVTTEDIKVNIPERTYGQLNYVTGINWSLSNSNAFNEIPEWAEYYSVNITKCLTTRSFLQSRVKNITYVTKDADDAYVFDTDTYAANLNGVGIDVTLLNSYGMGYVFTEGDLVNVYISTDIYRLSIVGQEGKWIICELQDLGALGDLATPKTDALFQVFTPYRPSVSEPHYEVGQIFSITNPGETTRQYSTLAGIIGGDVTLLTRNDGSVDYLTENMSPNDKFYTRWNTDSGRPNFVDTIGQETKTNDIAYSDVIIQGTKTNGLSTFEALNTKDVPIECGDITKLQVADKITEQGNIMLALCVNETVSLYLSESQLLGTSGNAFIAQSADVIGTINVLQGSYGTLNPESVILHRGQVGFYCLIKGCFVVYSNAGLFPVSNYGMKRVSHLFSQAYAALSEEQIEALGSRPFVFGGVDPYHEEMYWSIPATTDTPPKGYLEDYVSPDLPVIYPYDIYDGTAKVLVYKPNQDRWATPHNYQTEGFADIRDFLFSAKNGAMYKHNNDNGTDDTYCKWYGESVKPAIGFIINEEPNIVKQFLTLSVEGNAQPSWCHQRTELPFIQSSDLVSEWVDREGVLYSQINRDRLSPNATGTFDEKLYTGDKLRGQWMKVYAQFTTNQLMQIRFFNAGVIKSNGGNT